MVFQHLSEIGLLFFQLEIFVFGINSFFQQVLDDEQYSLFGGCHGFLTIVFDFLG